MAERIEMIQNIVYSDMEDNIWIVEETTDKFVFLLHPLIGDSLKDSSFESHTLTLLRFYEKIADNEKYRQFTLKDLRPIVRHLLVLYMWNDIKYE